MNILHKKPHSKHKMAEVISVVSHQLKTPLSIIKGYVEVLVTENLGKINEKQKEYLMDVLENTLRMIGLVNDLLQVSQIEEREMRFVTRPSSLEKITREAIKEYSSLARAKNRTISLEVIGKIPLLNIDALKIKQVVINLISNAITYNMRKGVVDVTIKTEGNNVLFSCRDSGVGISEDEKKKIFAKFHRSEQAITLSTDGSGLGLFISRAIIKKSGGKIWFKSKKDEGSTFYFSIPIK